MNIQNVQNDILINELQLGEQLNQCVNNNRRYDFSLMLAMLTDDVRDHAQFKLPVSQSTEKNITEDLLRREFDLPNPQKLALENVEQIAQYNQAQLLDDSHLTQLHLLNAISPNPLAFRDDVKHLETQVTTNTSIHCQHRIKNNTELNANPLSFNAKEWLKAINETIVKTPLQEIA